MAKTLIAVNICNGTVECWQRVLHHFLPPLCLPLFAGCAQQRIKKVTRGLGKSWSPLSAQQHSTISYRSAEKRGFFFFYGSSEKVVT